MISASASLNKNQICKDLQQFLFNCYKSNSEKNSTQIISISLEIDKVDPLVVFEKITKPHQLNFYWENKSKNQAVTAIDAVAKLEFSGKERFLKAEKFIQNCLQQIKYWGTGELFSQPQFFCGFSFFDQNTQTDYPFPTATVFLPRWQVAVKNNSCYLVMNTVINAEVNIYKILQDLQNKIELLQTLKSCLLKPGEKGAQFDCQHKNNSDKFKNSVLSALEAIKSNRLSKIVLADILDVSSRTPFNLCNSLNNLREIHPNCYVFCLSNGKGQHFIGASPERLISVDQKQLMTDALAGSAPRGKTSTEDAVNADILVNSIKEKHEHKLVIDFITQRLSQLGLLPQVLAPRLRQLSNIQHLWTPISADIPANIHPLKIVSQLHPTPAVAGESTAVACEEIRHYESFERGLYAAPLGWIDAEGNCEFIVGIRSALIDGNSARLYAGAGIVSGSDPEKEFGEVQLKLQALLKALV
ncbi:MAG TPA: isochorismate synthase [Nostocaceae cyanobacterium]|nr:isochorismate synthase [Nostocaceae cyanobacterium]